MRQKQRGLDKKKKKNVKKDIKRQMMVQHYLEKNFKEKLNDSL